jgi:hypothetical protein
MVYIYKPLFFINQSQQKPAMMGAPSGAETAYPFNITLDPIFIVGFMGNL